MRCAQRLALSVACTFAGWLAANVLLLVVDLAWDARYALTFTVAFASSAALLVGATWLVLVAPLVALAPRAWLIFRLPWGVLFGGTVGGALGLLLLGSLGCLGWAYPAIVGAVAAGVYAAALNGRSASGRHEKVAT